MDCFYVTLQSRFVIALIRTLVTIESSLFLMNSINMLFQVTFTGEGLVTFVLVETGFAISTVDQLHVLFKTFD